MTAALPSLREEANTLLWAILRAEDREHRVDLLYQALAAKARQYDDDATQTAEVQVAYIDRLERELQAYADAARYDFITESGRFVGWDPGKLTEARIMTADRLGKVVIHATK